jgi:hypothetical protein
MPWRYQSVAEPGKYLYAVTVSGLNLDLFGAVSNIEVAARMAQYVKGVVILDVQVKRELFSGEIRVFAQAQTAKSTDDFAREVEAAVNSFWTIAGVKVTVMVNDNVSEPPPSDFSGLKDSLKWAAIALVAIVVLVTIANVRKVT